MDKNGDNLELQTLLNGKEEEQINGGEKQKNSSAVNGEDEQYLFWRKAAISISCASVVFTTAFGGTFFVFSQIAGSPAAFGFALAAVLDSLSSLVVLWRFSVRESQETNSFERERRACIAIATCFIISAFAIVAKALYTLVVDSKPSKV
ncbi:transmembrane protein 163-like [Orbicella faveolata]|uniref:transmembrane protein 163-like n=1 Tax=Orbicella faveolata TaxID=48498 RepID=UPI0009E3656E|nr:transmembrane protein 163-like [Orbicella faveolata]